MLYLIYIIIYCNTTYFDCHTFMHMNYTTMSAVNSQRDLLMGHRRIISCESVYFNRVHMQIANLAEFAVIQTPSSAFT